MSGPSENSSLQQQIATGVGMPKAVSLSLIGIGVEDRQLLLQAFSHHPQGRLLVYTLVPLSLRPDILLVNADDTRALAMWVRYRNYIRQLGAVPPSVVVSRYRIFDTAHYQLQGPIDVQSAINTLDRVTREKLGMDDTILLPIMAQGQSAGMLSMAGSDSATSLDATALPNVPLPSIIAGSMVTTAQPRAVSSDSSDLLSLTATRSGASQPKERPATVRALIVDDSLPVRIQMRQALQPFSWKVDYAETGEEALPMLDANDYDIVFLDVVMPGIDGYEVCRYAKSGRARETPVVMLTSASSPADRVKGKLAGCNTYLIKPVTPPVLKQLIEQYLSVR